MKNSITTKDGYVTVITNTPDLRRFAKNKRDLLIQKMKEANDEIGKEGVRLMQKAISDTDARASNKLYNSVVAQQLDSVNKNFTNIIHFQDVNYAYYANFGRGAGRMPPFAAIARWASAKGIDPKLVGRIRTKIGEVGTKGKGFIQIANIALSKRANQIFEKKLREFKNGN